MGVSSLYFRPICLSACVQILFILIGATGLDFGVMARAALMAALGFDGAVAVIVFRRPQKPAPGDIGFILFGYFAFFVAIYAAFLFLSQ